MKPGREIDGQEMLEMLLGVEMVNDADYGLHIEQEQRS